MLRYALLAVLILALSACGEPSRAITGTAPHISVEQTTWLEQGVERDCARIPQIAGKRVQLGRFIARLEGEVFAGEHVMKAAMRGLLDAGVHVYDAEATQPVDYILVGSAYLASEMTGEGRKTVRKYTVSIGLRDPSGEIGWSCSYAITNAVEQPRFK